MVEMLRCDEASLFVADSISPSDDGRVSLNINAFQNGALCRKHI